MKICLVVPDQVVGKDQDFVNWDYSGDIASNIHAVQFDTDTNTGEIEYNDGTENLAITSLPSDIQAIVDLHATKKSENAQAEIDQNNQRQIDIDELRELRNQKLSDSDWTQASDSPLSDSDKTAWATYRQSLRDMTDGYTTTAYEDITFPTKP